MIEVGIRELKGKLSYYVHLMQAGETVAIKVRNHVVGFLSKLRPDAHKKAPSRQSRKGLEKMLAKWKKEGLIWGGKPYRYRPFKAVKMTPGPTASEMIRQMRDEGL